ncbi:VOC family protein [Xanthocytophaga flava]|uniref:VOC family protein n=1 Tax=Xanthocytophaga flava TaxID=3048013 RepID=UPI0028D27F46|nr:VOC family protein [Xanthocytophaga flavus]MDJ1469265.1 VOC family protein [Xanthocytophaga flavus]
MISQDKISTTFDHLIFGSYSLEDGVSFIYERLGVLPQKGGQHLMMGTHNAVVKLEDQTYLEVIAIDPSLSNPQRPRWFGMDTLQPGSEPKLLTWVVRTNDIQGAVDRSTMQHGKIESLQRDSYQWQIAIPENGQMPLQGIAPTIIQWQGQTHPAQLLSPSDLTLEAIEAWHPNATEVNEWLSQIGYQGKFTAHLPEGGKTDKSRLKVTLGSKKGNITFESFV